MIFQYVFRNLKKRFIFTILKITGLTLGLTGVLFLTLFLKNELSYDSFYPKADRIYRFTTTSPSFANDNHFARIYNAEIVPELANYFPQVESYVRLDPILGGVIKQENQFYKIKEAFVCDSTFLDVFNAPLLIGDKNTILNSPASMILSESFSKKLFGDKNPVGETISVPAGQYYSKQANFVVKGVMKDFPQNSHLHPDLIATSTHHTINGWAYTYLLLKKNTDPESITSAYPKFLSQFQKGNKNISKTTAYLQKITNIHLHSNKLREIETNGNMTNIYVLIIALIVLFFISINNYMGLTMGMMRYNQKFTSIARFLGSTKNISIKYSAIEAIYIFTLSILFTFIFSFFINHFIKTYYNFNLFNTNLLTIIICHIAFYIIGIVTALFPAIKISLFTHKNYSFKTTKTSKGFLISQFTLVTTLIIAVLVIYKQNSYTLQHAMGIQGKDKIICLESVHASVQKKFELFKSELLKYKVISDVSAMMEPPGGEDNDRMKFSLEGYKKEDESQENTIGILPCDYSFTNLFHLQFLAGNTFTSENKDADGSGEYIINETAMHFLNINKPDEIVGKQFKLDFGSDYIKLPEGKIIGVVKDFYLSSMKMKVNPLVLFKRDNLWLINFVVSYPPNVEKEALEKINQVWKDLFPSYPISYEHVDAMYKKVYQTELLQEKLLSIFAGISLFICCMGLLGLSLLITQQRIKEIGVRKVNGATVSEVAVLLNKDMLKWIIVSFSLAIPIGWFIMHKWLQNFAYKTEMNWWLFVLAAAITLIIGWFTVYFQIVKTAKRNPVEALRYE